jgi:hypothetical protein
MSNDPELPMARQCPHCGVTLPPIADGFCSECRGDLDDVPTMPTTPAEQALRRAGPPASLQALSVGIVFVGIGSILFGRFLFGVFILLSGGVLSSLVYKQRSPRE